IPKSANAFFCFKSRFIEEKMAIKDGIQTYRGSTSQTSLSRNAAVEWNSMGPAARLPYVLMAKDRKREHEIAYTSHKYTPRNPK
ncbi:hypothetical protein C8J57DRAFT_983127, partial [Mycena rebaudengoi]